MSSDHVSLTERARFAGSWRKLFDDIRRGEGGKTSATLESQVEERLEREVGLFSLAKFHVEKLGRGYAELTFPYSPTVMRQGGTLHGGIIAFALDEASELAVRTQNMGVDQVTIEMKTNFLQAALNGPFHTVAKTIRSGRTISVAEAVLRDAKGKLCAKSIGTYYMVVQGQQKTKLPRAKFI